MGVLVAQLPPQILFFFVTDEWMRFRAVIADQALEEKKNDSWEHVTSNDSYVATHEEKAPNQCEHTEKVEHWLPALVAMNDFSW